MQPVPSTSSAPLDAHDQTGLILHVQRLSTEDGPGIRTTVFFKGCPLHCAWCHNPESISPRPQVHWLENNCIGCLTCLGACPNHALSQSPLGIERDRLACRVCGACAHACPASAHEMLGKTVTVAEFVPELLKDRVYFQKSGGGVTLSGGEPAMQPAFAQRLLEGLREAGISTAVDTSGLCAYETLERLAAASDLVLYDLKHIDSQEHHRLTGVENTLILTNLQRLAAYLDSHPDKSLWIRTPIIPGATYTQQNLAGTAAWLAAHIPQQVERWEMCAFNNLCRDKYRRLDLLWNYGQTALLNQSELNLAYQWAAGEGFPADRIFVTGAAREEGV
jgi:pyruvate formate lyase activating enzyme